MKWIVSLFAFVCSAAGAQTPAPAPSPAPKPCSSPEYRQFDFWLGEWTVTNPAGKYAGTNRITLAYGGCAIHEDWSGAGGMRGGSYNIYDSQTRRWHQTWVDSNGGLLQLDGEFRDGVMRMQGSGATPDGKPTIERISWSKLDGGRLRQLWEQSADGGKSWAVIFDGTYAKK